MKVTFLLILVTKEYEGLFVEEGAEITINEKLLRRKSSYDDPRKQRSVSMMMERVEDNKEKLPDILLIMNFLEERNSNKIIYIFINYLHYLVIQTMITDKRYKEALTYFEKTFSDYKSNNKETSYKKIITCIVCLIYLEQLKNQNYSEAFETLDRLDSSYWSKILIVSLYDQDQKIVDYSLEVLFVYNRFNIFTLYLGSVCVT